MCKDFPSSATPHSAQGHNRAENLYTSGPLVEPSTDLMEIFDNRDCDYRNCLKRNRIVLQLEVTPGRDTVEFDGRGDAIRSACSGISAVQGGTDRGDI